MGLKFMNSYTDEPKPKLELDPVCPGLRKKVNQFTWIVTIQDVKINSQIGINFCT